MATAHTTKTDDVLARDARALGDVLKVRFYPLAIDRAAGCTITDVDGQHYLDFMAGWAVANTGYGTPEILDPVIAQMHKTSFCTLTAIMNERYSNVIEMTPPLTLTREQANQGLAIIDQALCDVEAGRFPDEKLGRYAGW